MALATKEIMQNRDRGLIGARVFDSGNDGPVLYVGAMTHGNEHMTTAPAVPLLNGTLQLMRGKVIVVVNNIDAARLGKRSIPDDEFGNFNRMDPDVLSHVSGGSKIKSVQRMQAIAKSGFLKEATHCLDAHTNNTKARASKLHIKGSTAFAESIPVNPYITNIVPHQFRPGTSRSVAFGNFIGGLECEDVPVVELEGGGPHDSPAVIQRLIDGFVAILAQLEMVDMDLRKRHFRQDIYNVVGSTWAPATGYRYKPVLKEGGLVRGGTDFVVPINGVGEVIRAPYDFHALMIGKHGEEEPMDDVVCFNAHHTRKPVTFIEPA